MVVRYTTRFLRDLKFLSSELQDEVIERVDQFRDVSNHRRLRVHKLRGRLSKYYSFSVNYRYRILFCYDTQKEAILAAVDDHSMYE